MGIITYFSSFIKVELMNKIVCIWSVQVKELCYY